MTISQRLKDVAVSETGFVFDPLTGLTFSVNATGRFILEQLRRDMDSESIADSIARDFDITDRNDVIRDIKEFFRLLKDHGIVPMEAEI